MKEEFFPEKLLLANIPTFLQKVSFDNKRFYMKRDDMTGVETTGNKIRKLEYLLADALRKKANLIITCGGEQSNHARATAAACAMLGLACRVYLWGTQKKERNGNLFLDEMFGAEVFYVNQKEYSAINTWIADTMQELKSAGQKPYFIPEGGSNEFGIWGYVEAAMEDDEFYQEKKTQGILSAAGTGGTTAGLLLGNALMGSKMKVFAVNVLYTKQELEDRVFGLIENCIRKFKLDVTIDKTRLEILDGYSMEGYKNILSEKIAVIRSFARQSGTLLDPAYTGKAFYAYQEHFLAANKTSKVMFLHTGGIFGAFAKTKEYLEVK